MATRGEHDLEEGAASTGVGAPTKSTVTNVEALKKRMDDYDKRWKAVEDKEHTIFRVPRNLREVGGKAYIPQMVSIGPYHYGNRRLEDMQKHKLRLLHQFLSRTKVDLDECIRTMIDLELEVKSCYAGLADNEAIDSYEFAEMMLLDACFILELFDHHFNGCSKFDPLFSPRAFIPCIRRDLLMLENQIPLLVLEHLFDLVHKKNDEETMTEKNDKELTVTSLALHFFKPAIESTEVQMKKDVKPLTCSMRFQLGSHRDTREIGIEVNNKNDDGIQGNEVNNRNDDGKPLTSSMCFQSGSHRDTGEIGIEVNNRNDDGIQGNSTNSTKQLHLLHIIRQSLLPSDDKIERSMPNDVSVRHLLHIIIQQSFLPSDEKTERSMPNEMHPTHNDSHRPHCHRPHSMTHCVSVLRDHGIKFEQKRNSTRIMDISFEGGHLQIPQLVINYSTRSILLNLMAFEQCYSQYGNHVTSYVNFMDGLINGPKDVSYLHHMKIIVHRLGSEEAVARLFNQLCREMTFDTDDNGNLSRVSKDIDQFIQKRRHKWWASLKHEYLRHPWAIISIFAAMFLLGLTVMGTLYAILSFHIHRS